MAFFNWFKKNKKDPKVKVQERKQNVFQDSAAAAAFAEADEHETARSMMDKTKGRHDILVVSSEEIFSEALFSYSLEMAQRLDFELLLVNATDAPLSLPESRREEAIALFREESTKNFSKFQERASQAGVSVNHRVEIGDLDDVVYKLMGEYSGLRYVLTEPDPMVAQKASGAVTIPVIDLGCYQRMTA